MSNFFEMLKNMGSALNIGNPSVLIHQDKVNQLFSQYPGMEAQQISVKLKCHKDTSTLFIRSEYIIPVKITFDVKPWELKLRGDDLWMTIRIVSSIRLEGKGISNLLVKLLDLILSDSIKMSIMQRAGAGITQFRMQKDYITFVTPLDKLLMHLSEKVPVKDVLKFVQPSKLSFEEEGVRIGFRVL